jgi:hypothetical protein
MNATVANPAVEMFRSKQGQYPEFPPSGWEIIQPWGDGYALRERGGLRLLIDCSFKADGKAWLHVSISRKTYLPSWDDMKRVKREFIGDGNVAVMVFPAAADYVNIHPNCHHLWHCVEGETICNFTADLGGVKSI